MLLKLLLFLLGFVGLIWGANYLIKYTLLLGKKYSVSQIVLGTVIIGFGTSLPELIISVIAAIQNSSDIAVSNVVGSNIANILLIIGSISLFAHIMINRKEFIKFTFVIFSALLLLLFAFNGSISFQKYDILSHFEGFIFLILFLLFLLQTIKQNHNTEIVRFEFIYKKLVLWKLLLAISIGLASLYVGGRLVVFYAIELSKYLGISEAFIGLTVLAVGSSLPEFITSLIAAYKKQLDLSIGNIIGSNLFNTFFILGIASLIRPLTITTEQKTNIIFSLLVSIMFLFYALTSKNRALQICISITFIILYWLFIFNSYSAWLF